MPGKPLPNSRIQIADTAQGHQVVANPNSGLVWECLTSDVSGNGKIEFEEGIYRTYGNVVIKDDLLLMADFSGLVHCIDARTGKRHWDYDVESAIFASPLIVDSLFYVGDDDGVVTIFRLDAEVHQPIAKVKMQSEIMTSPIFANGTLYIANRDTLFAIREEKAVPKAVEPLATTQGLWPQWRGPNRDNISTEQGLLQEWPAEGPPLSWRVRGLGQGISPVSVAGGRVGGHLFIREDDLLFRYDVRQNSPQPSRGVPGDISLQKPLEKPGAISRDRTQRSVFVPTPQDVVEKMLEIAKVQPEDLVYDLGSGDGRIFITAAKKFGCRAIGYEIDKPLVELSRLKAKEANVTNLVTIEQSDLFIADLRDADVLAVYLLPQQLEKLIPQLDKMKSGSRIITHQFEIPGVPPDKVEVADSTEDGAKHTLYLWTLPLKKAIK